MTSSLDGSRAERRSLVISSVANLALGGVGLAAMSVSILHRHTLGHLLAAMRLHQLEDPRRILIRHKTEGQFHESLRVHGHDPPCAG